MLSHEYLNSWLTGNIFAEYGDASETTIFDSRSRIRIDEVLSAIDGGTGELASALPRPLHSGGIAETLLAVVVAELVASNMHRGHRQS